MSVQVQYGSKSEKRIPMSELIVKKPKQEEEEEENGGCNSKDEQEEALVALIEHRTKEVQHLRQRISYYKSQVLSLSFLLSFFFNFDNNFNQFYFVILICIIIFV